MSPVDAARRAVSPPGARSRATRSPPFQKPARRPETPAAGEDGDRPHGNGHLEHGHGQREEHVVPEVRRGRDLHLSGLALDVSLLRVVLLQVGGVFGVGLVVLVRCGEEGDLRPEKLLLDAVGLVVAPLVGPFDVLEHRLVDLMLRQEGRHRGKHRQQRGGQGHAHDPRLRGRMGVMSNFFLGLFQGDFMTLHDGHSWNVYRKRQGL